MISSEPQRFGKHLRDLLAKYRIGGKAMLRRFALEVLG